MIKKTASEAKKIEQKRKQLIFGTRIHESHSS